MAFRMTKVRIGYVIDTVSCDTAGTQKQLIEMLTRLNRANFEPYLICLWKSLWMEANPLPCETFVLGYEGFLKGSFARVLCRFRKLISDKEFDIIQTFFEDSIFVTYLATLFARAQVLRLSSRRDMGLGKNTPWYHSIYRVALPLVNRSFDGIVANCEGIRKFVIKREKVPAHKVKVIYNGIGIPGQASGQPEIAKEWGQDLRIVLVANLTPVKRVDVLLEALAHLRSMIPGVQFRAVILGDGPEKGKLTGLSCDLGLNRHVRFMGAVRDVTAYLQHADLGVLSSDKEGFSNAILEYMACSLPVVATAVGGNVELIDSTNGLLVPPGDPKAMGEAIATLYRDKPLRSAMGRHSLEKVKAGYSWERAMVELETYYLDLLSKAPRKGIAFSG
jgi:glycosyltransferase involved in cell wall biosynthesis